MRRGGALLLAALLSAAAASGPARAEDRAYSEAELRDARRFIEENPDFGGLFTRAWEKVLGELDSLREHRDFVVRRRQVSLVITDTGHDIRHRTAARYVLGSVFLNRTYLVIQAAQLQRMGMDLERVAEVLAWKMMPVLAHEIRHGITEERMRRSLGFECGAGVLEDEELAFYDNALVAEEAIRLRPEFWSESTLVDIDAQNGTILARWKEGVDGVKALVREGYPGKDSVLSIRREAFARSLENDAQNLRKIISDTPKYQEVLRKSSDPEEREKAQAYLDTPPSAEEARALLAKNEGCRRAMRDPEAFAALREFYRVRLASARRLRRA